MFNNVSLEIIVFSFRSWRHQRVQSRADPAAGAVGGARARGGALGERRDVRGGGRGHGAGGREPPRAALRRALLAAVAHLAQDAHRSVWRICYM